MSNYDYVPENWGPVKLVPCVTCEDCGFQFGVEHYHMKDCHPKYYTCPACKERELRGVINLDIRDGNL